MNYASLRNIDIANGPGIRVSLFVSGCEQHCPGCFNKAAWDFQYGRHFTEKECEMLCKMLEPDYISGLTILGGEPLHPNNRKEVLKTLKFIKDRVPQKTIWLYTGYLFEDLLGENEAVEVMQLVDVLVDGPYVEGMRNLSLRFCGSDNQRMIDIPASLSAGCTVLWGGETDDTM